MPLDFNASEVPVEDGVLSTLLAADALWSGPEKWAKGKYIKPDGSMCFYGVLSVAELGITMHPQDSMEIISKLADLMCSNEYPKSELGSWLQGYLKDNLYLIRQHFNGFVSLMTYNDNCDTSFGEVKVLLAKLIGARRLELQMEGEEVCKI